jgi:hypothetical protein
VKRDQSKAMAQNKLLMLYLLDKSGMALSELQIMRLMDELGFMRYFDLKECLFELEQNGHILLSTTPQAAIYEISENGKNIVNVLEKDLRLSARKGIDGYLAQNREKLKMEAHYVAEYIKLGSDEYRVIFKVLEEGMTIMEINMVVYSRDEAQAMTAKWKDNAVDVYKELLEKLS